MPENTEIAVCFCTKKFYFLSYCDSLCLILNGVSSVNYVDMKCIIIKQGRL